MKREEKNIVNILHVEARKLLMVNAKGNTRNDRRSVMMLMFRIDYYSSIIIFYSHAIHHPYRKEIKLTNYSNTIAINNLQNYNTEHLSMSRWCRDKNSVACSGSRSCDCEGF